MTTKVLIADDDADQRLLLRRLFGDAGFDGVLEAVDGDDAVRVAREHQPDLVVLDLAMPGRSGIEALPDLTDAVPDARIVVVSNFPRWRVADAVRRRGAVGYVEKRVAPGHLVAEILVAAELSERAADRVSTRFPAERAAARDARRFVRDLLDTTDEELLATVELLVSELVTNAVLHASSSPRVDVHLAATSVRVEVYDDDATLPRPRVPDAAAPGGRGMLLVERMASQWGAEPHGDGKVVWFELVRR